MDRRRLLLWIGGLVLLVGLGGAALVYHAADGTTEEGMRYEVIDGVPYPTRLDDTKQFDRQMELYGGKSLVLVDALRRWFAALWHGKPLAFVIAFFSVVIAVTLFFAANPPGGVLPQDDARADDGDGDDPGR